MLESLISKGGGGWPEAGTAKQPILIEKVYQIYQIPRNSYRWQLALAKHFGLVILECMNGTILTKTYKLE